MVALLDVNVLVALLDPDHASHLQAQAWLSANPAGGWASCPLTENGCLRIMVNPRYANPHHPADVLAGLGVAKRLVRHEFWPDALSITDSTVFDWGALRGHQQVTDVYLLALAVTRGGRFVTFDHRIQRTVVLGAGPAHLEIL